MCFINCIFLLQELHLSDNFLLLLVFLFILPIVGLVVIWLAVDILHSDQAEIRVSLPQCFEVVHPNALKHHADSHLHPHPMACTHTHTHMHMHTHTHTHTHTLTCMHTHTHTRTQIHSSQTLQVTFCWSEYLNIWRGACIGYTALLMLALAFLSLQNAKLPSRFMEEGNSATRSLLIMITVLFLFIITLGFLDSHVELYILVFWLNICWFVFLPDMLLFVIFTPKVRDH